MIGKLNFSWLVLLAPALFFSCVKVQDQAFPAPPDLSTTQTEFIDTFSINQETYRFDTINTTSRLRLYVGSYEDPDLGLVEAKSFFQFLPSSYTIAYPDTFILMDSARIFLRYDSKYGRPGTDQFYFHKLTQQLDGDRSYYNFSPNPSYSPDTLLSTASQRTSGRFITINANSLGQEIVNRWKEVKTFKNDNQFLSYFPGMALISKSVARQITSFPMQDSVGFPPTFMRIYFKYRDKGDELRSQFDLKIDASGVHFSTIRSAFEGTPWAGLDPKIGKSAVLTNGKSAVQGGTALITRLTIPGLISWKNNQKRKIKVFKAELEIEPDKPGLYEPPTFIRIGRNEDKFIINESLSNIVFNDEQIFNLLQQRYSTTQAKNFVVSQIFPYNATTGLYKCNISSYIQTLIDGANTSATFNIYPHFWNSSFNRMLISHGKIRLKVYYYPLP